MTVMFGKPLALFLGLFLLSGGEKFAKGVTEFRAGHYEKAWSLLREAEKAYDEAELPSPLLVDLALAASQTQRFEEAEGYAERAAARDGGLAYLRDQVVGAARYSAASKANKEADKEKALEKLDEALTEIRRAIDAFGSASLARVDLPEPRRNLERALRLEKEIEKKKEAEDKKKKEDEKKKDPKTDPKKDQDKKDADQKKDQDKKDQDKKKDKKSKPDKSKESDPEQAKEDKKPKQLSREEMKRLKKVLEQYQKALMELKKSRAPKHQPGKRDW